MIKGYVNEALEPVVEIGLKRRGGGYNGPRGYRLCLAERHIEHLEMVFEFAEPYELANGEVVIMDVLRRTIMFGGRAQEVHLSQP